MKWFYWEVHLKGNPRFGKCPIETGPDDCFRKSMEPAFLRFDEIKSQIARVSTCLKVVNFFLRDGNSTMISTVFFVSVDALDLCVGNEVNK